jgi:amino acid transporter
VGITFFAYEGFRVITNTAEDMEDAARTLPRAIAAAVLIVMALYIVLAIAVLGSEPVDKVVQAKDYALAEAARPAFGAVGFTVVGITALISTASAINAGLYAATNVTYQLAKDGELPAALGRPIAHSTEGLVVSAGLIIALIFGFSLGEIAVIGSITVLVVHSTTHAGHLFRLRRETGASTPLVALAAVANTLAIVFVVSFEMRETPLVIAYAAAFLAASFGTEVVLQWVRKRKIGARVAGGPS